MITFLPLETSYTIFGFIDIPIWGIFAFLSILFGVILYLKRMRIYYISEKHALHSMIHFTFWTVIGTLIFYKIFFESTCSVSSFSSIFNINQRDSAGIVAGIVALFIYLKYNKLDFKNYLDMIIVPIIGLGAIMRVGCFLVADELGKVSSVAWSMFYNGAFRHNMGLYYTLINFFILGLLLYLEKIKVKKGNLFLIGLTSYSITRVFIDFLREIPPHIYYGLSSQQIFYLILSIIGLVGIAFNNNLFDKFKLSKIKKIKVIKNKKIYSKKVKMRTKIKSD
jgi:phosphatidylglycerol---prolipoprotein diacylglyceryl transferase